MKPTLRELLTKHKFDWENGRIVYQEAKSQRPGHSTREYWLPKKEITKEDPILDFRPTEMGGARLPRILAFDSKAIYYPEAYQAVDQLFVVYLKPEDYLPHRDLPLPYVCYW